MPGLWAALKIEFEKASKAEFERQMQEAGEEGGKKASAAVDKSTDAMSGAFKKVAGWLTAAFAVDKLIDFGRSALEAAGEAERAWSELTVTLTNVGINAESVKGDVDAMADSILKSTRFDDEAASGALNTMIQLTGDYTNSLKAMGPVADFAVAKHMGLDEAATIVGKAMAGNDAAMRKLIPSMQKGGDVMAALGQFSGAAAADMQTWDGQVEHTKNMFGEFKGAIGEAMIEAGSGASIMDTFSGAIEAATTWVIENKDQIAAWATVILEGLGYALKTAGFVISSFATGVQEMASLAVRGFALLLTGMQKIDEAGASFAEALGFDEAAEKMRSHANGLKETIASLGEFSKKTNKETEASHKQVNEVLGSETEKGTKRGTVAYQKMAVEAEKATKKFHEEVKKMTDDVPKLAESAVKEFDKILDASIASMEARATASQKKQLDDLKAHLLNARTEYEDTNTQVVINENMTQEQRRAAFERAAQAQQNIEANNVTALIAKSKEYGDSRVQQENTAQDSRRAAIVASGVVEQETDDAATNNTIENDGKVTTSTETEVATRVAAINTWVTSMLGVVNGASGIASAFGDMGKGVGNVLSTIQSGLGSVMGTMDTLTKSIATIGSETASLTGKIGALLGVAAAGAGLGSQVAGMFGGNKQGGSIGGAVGAGIGTAIGGPVGGLIGGALGGLVGGMFHGSTKDKNNERAAKNSELMQRAANGDAAALEQLRVRSQPGALPYDMWKDAAAKYAQVTQGRGNLSGQALADSYSQAAGLRLLGSTKTGGTVPQFAPRIAPAARSMVDGGSGKGATVNITQNGVNGDNVTGKTLSAIDSGMARAAQKASILKGNARVA